MTKNHQVVPLRFRTVWISDLHLGTVGCQDVAVADFLRSIECERLYLAGDIIDGWRLSQRWYWPAGHLEVIQLILQKAREGTEVVYVPGNHDDFLREFCPVDLGRLSLVDQLIHTCADGRRFLVIHGDQFDLVIKQSRWLALLGTRLNAWLLSLNRCLNFMRKKLGLSPWSLAKYIKECSKDAMMVVSHFKTLLCQEAKNKGCQGVICGHIHQPGLEERDGIVYANDGDWVGSCSALVEHPDGRLEIITWTRNADPGFQVTGENAAPDNS